MESVIYERIAEIEREHWWYEVRRMIVARLVDSLLPAHPNRAVLSAGCGTGTELHFLSRYGKVTGADPSDQAIGFCRSSGVRADLVQAPLERLPFSAGSFDAVFLLDVLEHIEAEGVALAEVSRVLKPGGLVVFTVPAFGFLWSRADLRAYHFRRYRRPELREVLSRAGFTPLRLTYFNTFLFLPIVIAKLISRVREPKLLEGLEVSMPPPILNRLLKAVFSIEALLLPFFNLPVGVSLLAVVRKPG